MRLPLLSARTTAALLLVIGLAPAHEAVSHDTTLASGLRLIVEERPETETIALRLIMLGGALDAPANRSALAQLHASLLVRSTEDHRAEDLSCAVETLGGRLWSGASLRAETIGFDGPAESTRPALKLLAEILIRPRLDPYDLEKEKGLLAGSIAGSHDSPSADLMDETYRAVFQGHPFSRLVRTSEEEVRAVRIDEVRKFHSRTSGPGIGGARIALVVVGRCTFADVKRIAGSAFTPTTPSPASFGLPDPTATGTAEGESSGRLVASGPPNLPPIPAPAPLRSDIHRGVHRRTTQAEIMIALPMDGIGDDDLPAYALLRHILGGFQERLYTEIREKRGYAYWVALQGFAMPTAGWIGVHTGASKKNLPEIERVVRAELARIVKEPVSAEELERARRYMTTAEARGDETNSDRAGYLTGVLLDARPARTYDENVARLASVTPGQVQDLARRLFANRHVAVVTLP